MKRLVLQRVGSAILLVWLVATAVFFLAHAAPGDPSFLVDSPRISDEVRAEIRRSLGLDRPLSEQYVRWLAAAVRGDWGVSLAQQRPVAAILAESIPLTLALATAAMTIQVLLGFALGTAAALHRDRALDHGIRIVTLALYSVPVFWLALMAILIFSVRWPILPAGGVTSIGADVLPWPERALDFLRHLALPAAVLGVASSGALARFVRASLLETFGQEWFRLVRSRGLAPSRVLGVHALRNAVAPVVQVVALGLPALLSGSLITEVVFSWPGLGRVTFTAVGARDYPVVLATASLAALLVILANLGADLLHAAIDPRVRIAESHESD